MAHWRISPKNSNNAPCKDKKQKLEKGMYVETSTMSPIPPLGQMREQPKIAQLFLNKFGIEIDLHHMNPSHFNCERIG